MSLSLVFGLGVPTILLLFAAGLWTDRRFSRFDELPAHYDFRGRPTRFASRRLMAWLIPITFSVILVAILLTLVATPPELHKGDPLEGLIFSCITMLAAQLFVCWLHERWAQQQSRNE